MSNIELIQLVGSLCSIISLVIAVLVLREVQSISNNVTASGKESKAAGGNISEGIK